MNRNGREVTQTWLKFLHLILWMRTVWSWFRWIGRWQMFVVCLPLSCRFQWYSIIDVRVWNHIPLELKNHLQFALTQARYSFLQMNCEWKVARHLLKFFPSGSFSISFRLACIYASPFWLQNIFVDFCNLLNELNLKNHPGICLKQGNDTISFAFDVISSLPLWFLGNCQKVWFTYLANANARPN